jgi:hypothetical protein
MKKRFVESLILMSFLCVAALERMQAEPIVYTFSGVGSGTLGAESFSDAAFAVTVSADTSNIVSSPLLFGLSHVPDSSATIFVNGLGTVPIITQLGVADSQNLETTGPAAITLDVSSDPDVSPIFEVHPGTKDYLLSEPIGPIGGQMFMQPVSFTPFATSDGDFAFSSLLSVTFQAALQPVPEPASLALLCAGGVTLRLLARKKWKRMGQVANRQAV